MRVEYVWKVELVVKKVDGKEVTFRARTKQMNDEWGTWQDAGFPTLGFGEGQTLEFSFPFIMDLPSGAKLS